MSKTGDYTTNIEWPDGKIENTGGLWVRKNYIEDTIEIWFDGNFQVSWAGADEIERRLASMIKVGVEIGEAKAKREIREFLGCTK